MREHRATHLRNRSSTKRRIRHLPSAGVGCLDKDTPPEIFVRTNARYERLAQLSVASIPPQPGLSPRAVTPRKAKSGKPVREQVKAAAWKVQVHVSQNTHTSQGLEKITSSSCESLLFGVGYKTLVGHPR